MIQPVAKLNFVRRYCDPARGWKVFVDIDASEEGRTGSQRHSPAAQARHELVLRDAPAAVAELRRIGACVGGRQKQWRTCFGASFPLPSGDRDIIAIHDQARLAYVVEVEGDSSGQPEGKIYKALGQLVCAASEMHFVGFRRFLILAAWGPAVEKHLRRAAASSTLGISGLLLSEEAERDRWLFGEPASAHVHQNHEEHLSAPPNEPAPARR